MSSSVGNCGLGDGGQRGPAGHYLGPQSPQLIHQAWLLVWRREGAEQPCDQLVTPIRLWIVRFELLQP